MRLLALLFTVEAALSASFWDNAGRELADGFSRFGSDVERGLQKGVSSLATGYGQLEDSVVHGYNQLEDSVVQGYNQLEDSVVHGYNQLEDQVVPFYNQMETRVVDGYNQFEDSVNRRIDEIGLNEAAMKQRLQNSMQVLQQAFNRQADIINKVEMPDLDSIRRDMRQSITPFLTYLPTINPAMNFGSSSWLNRYARKWWDGDNVCVTREELEGEDADEVSIDANINLAMQISKCTERYDLYTCEYALQVDGERKAYRTTYSCCRGFKMDENKVCKEFDIKPVEETLASLDGADFLSFISEENLIPELNNSTIFLPDNKAIDKFRKEIESALRTVENENFMYSVDPGLLRRRRDLGLVVAEEVAMKDMLLGHISPQVFNLNDVSNDQLVPTKSGGKIRMSVYNTYPKRTVLANCAMVTSKDHHASTSTVHVVDKVLKPAVKTIGEILEEDEQFRTFVGLLDDETRQLLRSENSSITVLAPAESAFQDLDDLWKAKVASGSSCSGHIVSSHIIPTVICSGVIAGRVRVTNKVNERVELRRDEDGKIYAENRELTTRDIVAKNGVLHVVESVILPRSARAVTEEIRDRSGQKFLDLMKKANLMEKLGSLKDFTLLLPSPKSLKEVDEAVLGADSEQLEKILLHHIIPNKNNKVQLSRRTSVQESLAGVRHHINHNTVSCARLQSRGCGKVCSGTVVEVDRLLVPAGGSVAQLLQSSSQHSTFLRLLEKTKLSEEIADGHFTVFAPTNSAFEGLPENLRSRLFGDNVGELKKVLQLHIIPDIVCCSSAPYSGVFPLTTFTRGHRSLAGHSVMMTRNYEGQVQANGISVDRCDTTALNGLMHSVNQVLLPRHMQEHRSGNFWDLGFGY